MVNLATPINQLPPAQPITNDPILVQEILKESITIPSVQIQSSMPIQNSYNSYISKLPTQNSIQNQYQDPNYLIKSFVLVTIVVFIVQISFLKEYIRLYIPQDELNLLIRCMIAGFCYLGLNFIF